MRLTTSFIAGFIAVGAATPAGLAALSTSTSCSADAATAQPTSTDGNWHIGCDTNNHCSYYQDSDIAAGSSADSLSPRTINLSEATCKQCTSRDPCSYCEIHSKFSCRDCHHYQCEDGYLSDQTYCFDIQPELAEVIRNHTGVADVTATIYETATSITVETSTTMLPTPTSESTITITRTAAISMITHTIFPPRHSGLASRTEASSNDVGIQPPVRRNAAFKQSQCVPCDAFTCPECHSDCAECEKFMCNDLATHLTVCMSVRSKWQPPNFNISASAPSETTTIVVMPQPGTATTTHTVVYSTIISTISTPSVSTVTVWPTPSPPVVTVTVSTTPTVSTATVIVVPQASTAITTTIVSVPQVSLSTLTIYPQAPQISTVVVAPPRSQVSTVTVVSQSLQLNTVTVIPQRSQTSTIVVAAPKLQANTISIQTSTITVQKPASTVVYQQPGTTSIVTYHYQDPASTVVYQQPGATSTITYHYQDPASTVVIQPPTVTASRSPSVIEVPVTIITTATHTVARSIRAVHTPAPMSPRDGSMAKSTCDTCDDNLECDGCDFACNENCLHFLCRDAVSGLELCLSVPEDAKASKANDAPMTPSNFLGSAAMLLVLDDVEDPTSNTSTSHLQPAVSNGTRPNFSFAEEDCYSCELGDESCGMCDWQFTCGTKKRCFHNGAREVVEMCFENGEKCRP